MNVAIMVAIVALVSTIVGATIGAFTNYALAVRRERSDDRNRAVEVKRAARLIDAELSRAEAAANMCIEKRHWWPVDSLQPLSNEAWQKYNGTVAPELTDEAWLTLRIGVEAVDNIRYAGASAVATGLADKDISDKTAGKLTPMLRDIKLGRVALAPLAGDSFYSARK